ALLLPAAVAGWAVRRPRWRRVAALCGLLSVTVFLILSGATTRAWWYLMPIYPPLALLCGMMLTQVLMVLNNRLAVRHVWRIVYVLPALLLITLLVPPYQNILGRTIGDELLKDDPAVHDAGVYLK